jgi:hypothetical protein
MIQLNCFSTQLTRVVHVFSNDDLKLVGIDYFDVHMVA